MIHTRKFDKNGIEMLPGDIVHFRCRNAALSGRGEVYLAENPDGLGDDDFRIRDTRPGKQNGRTYPYYENAQYRVDEKGKAHSMRCPFCGSDVNIWGGPEVGSWYAECMDEKLVDEYEGCNGGCGVIMQSGADSEEEAKAIWNNMTERTENEEGIASCPWCGKHPKVVEMDADIWDNKRMMIEADESTKRVLYYIGCETKPGNEPGKCAVTPEFWANTRERAIALWNGYKEIWDETDERE